MREYKFRAWDSEDEKMIWGCSNLLMDMGGNLFWQFGYNPAEPIGRQENTKYTLMQWTGLTDRHGKEIYEGDILGFTSGDESYRTGPVEYKLEFTAFVAGVGVGESIPEDLFVQGIYQDTYEVIGNIHEHPELLDQSE